ISVLRRGVEIDSVMVLAGPALRFKQWARRFQSLDFPVALVAVAAERAQCVTGHQRFPFPLIKTGPPTQITHAAEGAFGAGLYQALGGFRIEPFQLTKSQPQGWLYPELLSLCLFQSVVPVAVPYIQGAQFNGVAARILENL